MARAIIYPDEQGLIVGNKFKIGGGIAGDPDVHENSETQNFPVGTLLECEDGRRWRYTKYVATTAVGLIVSQDVSATALADTDGVLAAAGSGYNSVGDTQIRISSTDVSGVTLNQYAGGYVSITDDAGEGYTYRVRGNTATASNVTDLRLYDAIKVLLTTASDIMITGLMTWKARPATAATDAMVVGGSMAAMTANYFGWAQTRGVYTALTDLATVKGDILTLSDGVAGAVQTIGGGGTNAVDLTTEPTVGRCLADGDTTGHTAVFLTLE